MKMSWNTEIHCGYRAVLQTSGCFCVNQTSLILRGHEVTLTQLKICQIVTVNLTYCCHIDQRKNGQCSLQMRICLLNVLYTANTRGKNGFANTGAH